MQRLKRVLELPRVFAVGLLRLGAPVLIFSCGLIGYLILSHMQGAPAREPRTIATPLVETMPVETGNSRIDIEVDGVVVPYRELEISSQVSGRVTYKAHDCRAGRYVTKGTRLIVIDPEDFQLEVRRLSMELEQAKVMLDELDVEVADTQELIGLAVEDVELQRRELYRLRDLNGEQIVTETRVDQAARAELAARNALSSMRSRLRLLTARRSRFVQGRELASTQLRKAELDLERATITAPADGVIVRDEVEEHSFVQRGALLFTLEDTSSVEVKCNLRTEELDWVWRQWPTPEGPTDSCDSVSPYQLPSTPATVVYAASGREYVWDAVLDRYDGIGLDEKTRTAPCRIVVRQPGASRLRDAAEPADDAAVRPVLVRGMYVNVFLHIRPKAVLLKIPRQAVRPGNIVWLVEDGKLRRRTIEARQRAGDDLLVDVNRAGLRAGSRVVVSPLVTAYDGMDVRERQAL